MKILYVEDDSRDIDLVCRSLEKASAKFEVTTAISYQDAITHLKTHPDYDLILTDLKLPDGDGLSLITYIREELLPATVVVISGLGDEEAAVTALRAGADDYITKQKDYLAHLPIALEHAAEKHSHETSKHRLPLRVLYGEHHDTDIDLTRRHFNQHAPYIKLDVMNTSAKIRRCLANPNLEEHYDAILLDYRLPGLDTIDLIKDLTQVRQLSVPIMLITGQGNESVAAQAINFGAADYIVKNPGYLFRLPGALENAFHRAQLGREQKALRQAESRYRALVEQIPAATYTDAPDELSSTIYMSPRIEEISGYTPEEWVADPELWLKLIHPDDLALVKEENARSIADGDTFKTEYRLVARDGRIVWIRDEAVLVRDESGEPQFWQGVMLDITERKQSERALRESEERYRQLVNLSPEAIAVHSEGKFVFVNDAAVKLIGAKRPEELLGHSAMEVVHRDSHKIVRDRVQAMLEMGETASLIEEKFIRLDGQVIDVEVTAMPLTYQGKPAIQVIVRDITERKRAEAVREAIYKISQAAHTARNLTDLYGSIHSILSELMPAENFYIALFDANQNTISFPYYSDKYLVNNKGYRPVTRAFGKGMTEYVLRTGKPILAPMEIQEQLAKQGEVESIGPPAIDWLGVPLKESNRAIGVMAVQSYSEGLRYSQADADMLEFVSAQVATAIERKRTEEQLQRQLKELTVLHSVGLASTQATTLDELIEHVTQIIGDTLYPDNFGVLMLDETRGRLYPHPSYRGASTPNIPETIPLTMGISGQVATNGQPQRVGDVRNSPKYLEVNPEMRSELCVPIRIGEQVVGVINAESTQIDFFSEADERLLGTIAGQMGINIERLRLFESERIRRQEAETLQQAAAAITSSLDPNQVLEAILTALNQVVPYDSASVFLLEGNKLRLMNTRGIPNPEELSGLTFPADDAIFGEVQRTGKPLILDDAQTNPHFNRWGGTEHVHGWMGVPLIARGTVIGYITLDSRREAAYDEKSAALAQSFAHQAAVAIENARLYQDALRAAERRSVLHRVGQEVTRFIQNPEETYVAIHKAARELMPCDSFVISHWDRTHGEYDAVYLVEGDKRFPSQPIPEGQGLTGQVVSGGETIIIDDTDVADQGKFRRFGSPQRVRSLIATPLRAGDQITGMISAQSFQTNAFGEEERALIEMLAAYAATAIENSRLFEEIRRRLLELEGVNRVSTALRSAQTSAEMFPILLNETLSVLDTEAGCIWLYDPTSDELSMKVAHGWVKDLNNKHIKPSDGIVGHTFRTGEAHLSPDFLTDPYLHKDNQSTVPAGWGGASIPIRTSTETIGVFFIGVEAPRQLGQDEINLLTTLSEMAGNAIHRAELHERTERQVRRLTALRDVDIAIASSFDLRVTLNILIDQAISQLNVNAADILLYNPTLQNLSYIAGQGFISSGILQSQQRIGEGLAGKAILERSLIQVPDLNAEPHFARQSLLQKEEFVSYFAVPLVGKGQIKGVFEVFHRSSLSPSAGWLNFLQTLASQAAIAIDNAQLFENLQRTNQELSLAYDTTLEGWGRALELRDKETEGHTRRVTEMTVQLARRMGIGDEELTHVRRGVLLHDIGKMGVPDQILRKTGPLTEDEWDSMQNHPQYAYDLLYPIAYLRPALDIPYCHHERWDGRGYPRGLSGDEIPVAARIFSIIDVWDALLSDRPYRKAWSREKTLAYIKEQSGKRFDPAVVKEFLKMLAEEE